MGGGLQKATIAHRTRTTRESSTLENNEKAAQDTFFMNRELKIFSGNANLSLAQEIAAYLGQKLGEATVSSFSDGEIRVKIDENVRGADVFVVQSCGQPVNDSLMELWIIMDAFKIRGPIVSMPLCLILDMLVRTARTNHVFRSRRSSLPT